MIRSSVVAIALAAVAVGCSDSADPGDPRSEAQAAIDFCREAFGTADGRRATCESWSTAYRDLRAEELAASCDRVAQPVAAGREHFDGRSGMECLGWWTTTFAPTSCSTEAPAPPAACDETLQAAVPLGGECVGDADCIDGWCSCPEGACGGTCVALGLEGAPCSPVFAWPSRGACADPLTCIWTGSAWACGAPSAPGGEGDPCGLHIGCGPGLHCETVGGVELPRCALDAALGEACTGLSDCATGLVCGTQGACAQYVGEGSGCTAPTAECGAGLFCDGDTCVGLPDVGTSCEASRRCLRGYCSSTDPVCRPLKAAGEPCASRDECASFACAGGLCGSPACP